MGNTTSNAPKHTVYDMLMSAPDNCVYFVQEAHSAVLQGDWKAAAMHMYDAADYGTSQWHDDACELGDWLYNKGR